MADPIRKRAYDNLVKQGHLPKLGSGGRFKALAKQTGSPALAAYIGRKKYGAKKFGQLSAKGR